MFQSLGQFDVSDILAAYKKQFAYGLPVVFLTTNPFKDNESRKHQCCTGHSGIIIDGLELFAEFQQ